MSWRAIISCASCLFVCGCADPAAGPAPAPLGTGEGPVPPTNAQPTTPPSTADAAPPAAADAAPPQGSGVQYVPRESEEKLQAFLDGLTPEAYDAVTDEQVFAIMGPPTRIEEEFDGVYQGQQLKLYDAFWETPGSGVSSQIGFVNGRLGGGGMVLGLEVTP